MSVHTPADAATLVMDSANGFESLLEAAGTAAVARWENAWTNATWSNQLISEADHAKPLATFDNRPTWDNPTATFDNRPTWDNWKNQ
ncbi:multiple cyclophane-containing RiPP AmcA [Streptomyces sp. NPDC059566]|uniref:multiple cyclophane-containing RiPP AmcA n=1 Tax=Streptomyces sp. NPDC059566 TaxID=3346866 RepID=UPI0036C03731